ncbi:MAG: hypothetical protein DSZ03_02585 [Sulfurimonas sp.]|nr:MAG: hypothetical protein DSZ03_02585 [Sulfurimonas sp.]
MFERLYAKVYVVIIVLKEKVDVSIMTVHGDGSTVSRAEFELSQIASELQQYVHDAIAETPFFYVGVLNSGINQGAIPTCHRHNAQKYADLSLAKTLCIRGSYMLYSSKYELDAIEKMFQGFGVDFIFSPLTLLERIYKDKIETKAQLYVLIYEEYLAMAVFQHATLLFASFDHVDSGSSDTNFDDKEDDEAVVFDLDKEHEDDGINIDDLDALDNLPDLEDLDAIQELEDFTDEIPDSLLANDTPADEGMQVIAPSLEDFGISYQHFLLIQKRLESYYKDATYHSEFIETVFIADANNSSDDLKRFLEEELFLNVVVRHVNIPDELLALSMEEVQHAV